MAISSSQLKFYKSLYVSDSLTNGGRRSETLIVDNSINNLFRNIQSAERDAGITLYRKMFLKNENPNDLSFENPMVWISNITSGEDYFQIAAGTDTDNQAAADDYTDWYGNGTLVSSVLASATSFLMSCKSASGIPDDSTLMLYDGSQAVEVVMIGAASWNGLQATITVSGEIGAAFTQDVTIISPILQLDDLTPASSNWAETSLAGTYDEVGNPLTMYNIGAITESWTLTFSSSTAFAVSGAVTGSVGTGSISANFAPVNGAGYYFLLDKDGWGGSWVAGDTITFNTVHAAKSIWAKEVVPLGASSQANNLLKLKLKGESA